MAKDMKRYWRHREAWRRIKCANEQGFYFEAVTLCESIISGRLLTYIVGASPGSKPGKTFSALIGQWRNLVLARPDDKLPLIDGMDLDQAVDQWRQERNEIIHGLAKLRPGEEAEPLEKFMARASNASNKGIEIARAVNKWHKQRLAAHQNRKRK